MNTRVPEMVIGLIAATALFSVVGVVRTDFLHDFKSADVVNVALVFATIALWVATKNLVVGAEKTAELQLRAYLNVSTVYFDPGNNEENSEFIVEIKNFGQTPAYDCQGWIDLRTVVKGAQIAYPTQEETRATIRTITAPGSSYRMIDRSEAIHQPHQWDAIVSGANEVIGYGEINYRDIFGHRRQTKFRYVVGGDHGMPEQPSMFTHPIGNEAT